jgi:hypothetical protein
MRALLLILFLLINPSAFAEWRQFGELNENDLSMTFYYEPGSLIMGATRYERDSPNKIKKPKVSIMAFFYKKKPQFAWRATKFLWEANCVTKTVRVLASVPVTQMGQDIIPVSEEPYMEWGAASDSGTKSHIYNLLCTPTQ